MVAGVLPGDRVLDVGCNSGYLVDFVHPSCQVYGVDVSDDLVAKARSRLREAHVAPAESLPYADQTMDVVVLGEILEHVHDPIAVLREAARVSRRLVVGSTPHDRGKWGPRGTKPPSTHRFHVRCFTHQTLLETLIQAGLSDVQLGIISRDRTPQMFVFQGAPR